jgi:hypothetical protein
VSGESGKAGDLKISRGGEAVTEIIPEGDAELGAGLGQAEEGVAAITPEVAAGAAADLAPGDLATDVVLRSIGMQRDLRVVENQEQFGLFGVEARKQPIEGGKAGLQLEDALEAGAPGAVAGRVITLNLKETLVLSPRLILLRQIAIVRRHPAHVLLFFGLQGADEAGRGAGP